MLVVAYLKDFFLSSYGLGIRAYRLSLVPLFEIFSNFNKTNKISFGGNAFTIFL